MNRYSPDAYELAEEELSRRRQNAEEIHSKRTAEIADQAPEIFQLQRSLANTASDLVKLIAEGGQNTAEMLNQIKEKNLRTQRAIGDLLEELKGDRNYLDVPYHCKKCNDTGYNDGIRCECFKKLLENYTAQVLNKNCHIKMHDFSEFRLDYYESNFENGASPREQMQQIFQYCRTYANDFSVNSDSLFFFGKTGLGKTFLSSCIAKKVIENGYNVVFGSIMYFLRTVENEHFGRTGGDTLGVLVNADLLILDDLGSEFKSPFYESALYDIINSRINMEKPTIISTNLSIVDLNSTYNERIVSRITGCYEPVPFIGKDVRHVKRQFQY